MGLQFDLPKYKTSIIKVIGVGGGGGNAVNHMYHQGIKGVEFVVCNTDNQALEISPVATKIQLGSDLTEGRGAGSDPEVGRNAAMENAEEIRELLGENTKMVFITAGMGGGTGTGAAPVIAEIAREMGILTVGIVTTPFTFEGRSRWKRAMEGISSLKKQVDTSLVISNEKLKAQYGNLPLSSAFSHADNILATAAKGIAEIITVPGYLNVDFEDVKSVMENSGKAILGSSVGEGNDRAQEAVAAAVDSPLLSYNDIKGARYILLNITSGTKEILMDEITIITDYIQDKVGNEADVIWGHCHDDSLGEKISVTIIATSFEKDSDMESLEAEVPPPEQKTRSRRAVRRSLDDEETISQKKRQAEEEANRQMSINFGDEGADLISRDVKSPHKKQQELNNQEESSRNRDSFNIRNNDDLDEIERIPAYIRKRVNLKNIPHSSETTLSRFTLGDDNEEEKGDDDNESERAKPGIKKNNAFLHDNVD